MALPRTRGLRRDEGSLALDVLVLVAVVILGFVVVYQTLAAALATVSRHIVRVEEAIQSRNETHPLPGAD